MHHKVHGRAERRVMAAELHVLRPRLHVIEGGRKPDRRSAGEEAHMEVMAFFDEVEQSVTAIAEQSLGMRVLNECSRLAHRTAQARREWLLLTHPDGAA